MKCLGTNLTDEGQDSYTENYEILLNKIKEISNKQEDILRS